MLPIRSTRRPRRRRPARTRSALVVAGALVVAACVAGVSANGDDGRGGVYDDASGAERITMTEDDADANGAMRAEHRSHMAMDDTLSSSSSSFESAAMGPGGDGEDEASMMDVDDEPRDVNRANEEVDADAPPEEPRWTKHYERESGKWYYYDASTGTSQWEVPVGFVEEEGKEEPPRVEPEPEREDNAFEREYEMRESEREPEPEMREPEPELEMREPEPEPEMREPEPTPEMREPEPEPEMREPEPTPEMREPEPEPEMREPEPTPGEAKPTKPKSSRGHGQSQRMDVAANVDSEEAIAALRDWLGANKVPLQADASPADTVKAAADTLLRTSKVMKTLKKSEDDLKTLIEEQKERLAMRVSTEEYDVKSEELER